MPLIPDISKHRENIADLTDKFSIRNFILGGSSQLPAEQQLNESFIFNGFVFSICLRGSVTFKFNYREYTAGANTIFTSTPGQIVKLVDRSEDLIFESLFLSSDYILQLPLPKDFDLLKKLAEEPVQKITPEVFHNMLELHSMVAKYHRREDNRYKEYQTKALIFALLTEIAAVYSQDIGEAPKALSRQEVLADEFFTLLLEHFKSERGVAFYADKMCLTPKYLSMTVKSITGHPISDWINEAVILEAKRLLKVTDMTALQISEELNFPNPSFFGRFFKQYAGMTPLQYKES